MIDGTAERACLEFEIKRCMAPCTGNQTKEDYHRIVRQVRWFLEGRDQELLAALRDDMYALAEREAFEDAARLRDRILKVERTLEKQRVAQIGPVDQDVLGLARAGTAADVQLLFVRGGLIDRGDGIFSGLMPEKFRMKNSFALLSSSFIIKRFCLPRNSCYPSILKIKSWSNDGCPRKRDKLCGSWYPNVELSIIYNNSLKKMPPSR